MQRLAAKISFEDALSDRLQGRPLLPRLPVLKERPGELDHWRAWPPGCRTSCGTRCPMTAVSLAEKGAPRTAVLREQVERMLKDPKAERFVAISPISGSTCATSTDHCRTRSCIPSSAGSCATPCSREPRAFFAELAGQGSERNQRRALGLRHAQPAAGRALRHPRRRSGRHIRQVPCRPAAGAAAS